MNNQSAIIVEKAMLVFFPMTLIIAFYPYFEASVDIDRFLSMVLFSIFGIWFLTGLFLHNPNLVFDLVKRAHWSVLVALTLISTASCYVMFNLLTKSMYGKRYNFVIDLFMTSEWFQTICLFLFLTMTIYIISSQIFLLCSRYIPRKRVQEDLEIKKKIHWSPNVKRVIEEKGTIYDSEDKELQSYIIAEVRDRSDTYLLQSHHTFFSPKKISGDISEKLCRVILNEMRENFGWDLETGDFSFFFNKYILVHSFRTLFTNFFEKFKASFESDPSEPIHPRSFLLFLYYVDEFNQVMSKNQTQEIIDLYFSAKSGKVPGKLQNNRSSKNTLNLLCMFTYFSYEHYLKEHNYANEDITSFINQLTHIFNFTAMYVIHDRYLFNKKYLTDPPSDLDLSEQINFNTMRQTTFNIKQDVLKFLKKLNQRRNLFDPKQSDENDFDALLIQLQNKISLFMGVE